MLVLTGNFFQYLSYEGRSSGPDVSKPNKRFDIKFSVKYNEIMWRHRFNNKIPDVHFSIFDMEDLF